MLELIVQVLSYIKQITYFGLVLSYKTGQLIVYSLNILTELLVTINRNFGALLRVLFEDFSIFLHDVGQRLLLILTFASEIVQGFLNCLASLYETIKLILLGIVYSVTETYNLLFNTFAKLFAGLGQAVVTIKHLILLVGSGIWFALTIIPLFIVYTCTMFTYYLGCFADELINFSTNTIKQTKVFVDVVYEFITDVPVESIAGLVAGACILYVLVKFQILLYEKLLSAVELIRHNSQQIRSSLLRRLRRNPPPIPHHSSSESEQTDTTDESSDELEFNNAECSEDRVCIICQERNKCILMLPCRHVCLCYPCNVRLRNYNRTCPICRSVVQRTMKVFV